MWIFNDYIIKTIDGEKMNIEFESTKKLTKFDNLEKRIIASFYLTMPGFYPFTCASCTEQEQKNLYDFMYKLYKILYENPNLIFKTLNEDFACSSVFTTIQKGSEKQSDLMRKEYKELVKLITFISDLGKNGNLNNEVIEYDQKVSSKYCKILECLELNVENQRIINKGKPFFRALKWFSCLAINIRHFSYCAFDIDHDYLSSNLALLCNKEEKATEKIIEWLRNNNYKVVSLIDKYPDNNDYSIHFIKNIHNTHDVVGFSYMGDPNHIGFSMEYRYSAKIPYFCTLRIQNMKSILQSFDKLSPRIQSFIINTNKKCNNCKYCVQTDKTGLKPKAYTKVDYENKSYLLCPYYPGFSYSFRDVTIEDSETFIEFLKVIEKFNLN